MLRMLLLCLVTALSPLVAFSATITSNTIDHPTVYQFDGGPRQQGGGPYTRVIGDNSFIFTSTNSISVFDTDGRHGFSSNGQWDTGFVSYAALNAGGDNFMSFTFLNPVRAVGGFMKYAVFDGPSTSPWYSDARLRIRNTAGDIIESFNLNQSAPIVSLGVDNDGAFRGFQRAQADIKTFELVGGFLAIADLTISQVPQPTLEPTPAPVPLPATGLLLLAGVFGLAAARCRR